MSFHFFLKQVLRFFYDEVFYNGHFQTWGSLAIVISVGQLLNIKIGWDLLIIVYLAFYLLYLHDRYRYIEIDSLTNITRSRHIKKIYKYVPYILLIGLIALFFLLYYFSNFYASIFIILITIFGFLYPLYFKKLTKKIVAFKDFYVALVFSLLTLLPNVYYKIPFTKMTFFIISCMFIFTLLRGLMMQFFLDLKDMEGDKKEGLLTLSIILGKEKVYKLINAINLFTCLSFPILYFFAPFLSLPPSILFLILLAAWNYYFFSLAKKGNFFGFVLGSGEFIYWPLFVYMGQIILK